MTSTNTVKTIEWANGVVRLIDQTRLPDELVVLEVRTPETMVEAIQSMRIRGAPALGVAGAYGLALAAQSIDAGSRDEFLKRLRPAAQALRSARPTAVNLAWAVDRVMDRLQRSEYPLAEKLRKLAVAEAARIHEEDLEANRRIGRYGADLLPESGTVLTHCNAGALATAGYGTALGVLRAAREAGKDLHVLVDETRPLLQGARLTAWELSQEGIPATLITDSMAGYFLHSGKVQCVVVGADRIAANGDVANKIGTYSVAVLARENGVPFYVAAPTSTIDLSLPTGDGIPIEERRADEVTSIRGVSIAPAGMPAANPAFDVTPSRYVTAIITERGIVRPPYEDGLKRICEGAE